MMRKQRVTALCAAVIALAVIGVSAPALGAARAASRVRIVEAGGWTVLSYRPRAIHFGQGGAPFVTRMRWRHWNGSTATGTGKLHIQNPCDLPSYECTSYSTRPVTVRLSDVKVHGGKRYFDRMLVTFRSGGKMRTRRLHVVRGFWSGALIWPYF
jgi:hypothetical protein